MPDPRGGSSDEGSDDDEMVDYEKMYDDLFSEMASQQHVDLSNFKLRDAGVDFFKGFLVNSSITHLKLDFNDITDVGAMFLAKGLKGSNVQFLSLTNNQIASKGALHLSRAFKCISLQRVDLSNNRLGDLGVTHLANCLNLPTISHLSIRDNNIQDEGAMALSEWLPYSMVTKLELCNNDISYEGAKHLAEALKHTHITHLQLDGNNIDDEGVKVIAEDFNGSKVTHLNLSRNRITGIYAANYFAEIVSYNPNLVLNFDKNHLTYSPAIKRFHDGLRHVRGNYMISFDVFYENNSNCSYISHHLSKYDNTTTIYGNNIGGSAASYLNELYRDTYISELVLKNEHWGDAAIQDLTRAFDRIAIQSMTLTYDQVIRIDCMKSLEKAFAWSKIFVLNIDSMGIGVERLIVFLKAGQLIELRLGGNSIGNEGLKCLAPALKYSSIMNLQIPRNNIQSAGVQYLAEVLRDTHITTLNLGENRIGPDGAKALAEGLKRSQVTNIDLKGNQIGYRGYEYLRQAVDDTNIMWENLCVNNIESGMKTGKGALPRKDKMTNAHRARETFERFTCLNDSKREFEFIVPQGKLDDLNGYLWLMQNFSATSYLKVHVIQEMCVREHIFDFRVMEKICKFTTAIQHNFNVFFNNQILTLYKRLGEYDYLAFIRHCEMTQLYEVVKNLLQHRELFYVDADHEILHPLIYKLLKKYDLSLYSEQLEPNKRALIIEFYQHNLEIEGAQEVIDILKS